MYILWILIGNFFFSLLLLLRDFLVLDLCSDWTVDCTYLFVSDVRVGYEVARIRG
ncbi:hypothetical protein M6B38_406130 [Iris pallida]|uniref:Uncharacterized protein n=1 Tax=Iris pallida TaxID=29817 RepID=A0AAX6FQF4_IRIPA|nr:hypothetical protein M6B38_406130 [Iris pallida]